MSPSVAMADDARARAEALDVSRSFIVQAPAGSGKTELLIQRYLRLLACVREPEEVLAITFTRKAAGEMRTRVIKALCQAEAGVPPPEPHLRTSYELALTILSDERRRGWQLHRHPARLAISTIDAVNAWLAGRAPLTAGNTALQRVTDRPQHLYHEAARATLELLGEEGAEADRVATLLAHLDNDAERFERLIAVMLPRREQWLRHIPGGAERTAAVLESPLRALCEEMLQRLCRLMPPELATALPPLLSSAAKQLAAQETTSPLLAWRGCEVLPAACAAELPRWRALAGALLKKDGAWRRRLTQADGFAPGSPAKAQFMALLAQCQQLPDLREALDEVRMLPEPAYGPGQWEVLRALLEVLPLAAAQLRLVFIARGACDFAEVAADALHALGTGDEPTEVGLALDHRIQHLLVDEFQDTSTAQFDLLVRLVAGWHPGDGRTLFLVGDPMQSVYRFREAEVRLFMKVRDEGLGEVRPAFLQLHANFRSDPAIVDWVNSVFSATFPAVDDAALGMAKFARSEPVLARDPGAQLALHWLAGPDPAAEGRVVADIVADCRRRWPDERVGILVRSRGHATSVISALRRQGIAFVAPDLEILACASLAQDLLALTRAVLHPADRLAWLAVLRAPWCGLSLCDMERLVRGDEKRTVWDLLHDEARCRQLSAEGAVRLARVRQCLAAALAWRGRRALRDLIEGAWLALGGPASVAEPSELPVADAFFDQLERADDGGDCRDIEAFTEELASQQATLAGSNANVLVMTMHRAKGLEFDTVILPGLNREPRGDERPLLLWHEVRIGARERASVLAPLSPSGGTTEALYEFLWRIEQRKQLCEQSRLLYVACTRAKRRLHLLATLTGVTDSGGTIRLRRPRPRTLLARIWPAVEADAQRAARQMRLATGDDPGERGQRWREPRIRRLSAAWRAPAPAPAWQPPSRETGPSGTLREYQWVNRWAVRAGLVVHHWLQRIAEKGVEQFDVARIEALDPAFRRMLVQLGAATDELDAASARVRQALAAAVAEPPGRWILCSRHKAAASELPLTVAEAGTFRQLVIDRTFVDADGTRWVIDYKISPHEGGDRDGFLRSEVERHREQLRRYRDAMRLLGGEPVRTALYFPLLGVLQEVALD